MEKYDVVVIGGGPGGYVAAIRCAQLGLKTACIDDRLATDGKPALGGTCLNVGCIPSKALLDSSHHYQHIRRHAADHGIKVGELALDLERMMARKDRIVRTLTGGVASLFKKHRIAWHVGHGRLDGNHQVVVQPPDNGDKQTISAEHIIIASGSTPAAIPQAEVDNRGPIIDSTGALALTEVPARLGVIGAGVIGLELGSVWNRLGAEVVILEALEEFLPDVDRQIAAEARKSLTRQGLDLRLGGRVTGTRKTRKGVRITYEDRGGEQLLEVDRLIVAVGRKPNTDNLGAEAEGLRFDQRGWIQVDDHCRTNIPGIWAIGDVVRGPMLAHKAMDEGVAVAERIAGRTAHLDYDTIPWVIYTWPEIAWVGATEQQLRDADREYRSGTFPFMANGRARAMGDTEGLVKILSDAESDRVLGVHIFGPYASELIGEAVLAMSFEASSEDIARTIHAHPTLSEALHEAALAVDQRTLHL